jgi:hypothetical protein
MLVRKFGDSKVVEVGADDACPACEFARSALRDPGDVIFVHVFEWDSLRRVECIAAFGGLPVMGCTEVTEEEARKEIAAAAAAQS